MDVIVLHKRTVEAFLERVESIGDDRWSGPTPCPDWDVRALVNHVVGEDRWTAPLLGGSTIAEVGDRFEGDLLGADPVESANDAAAEAVAAVGYHLPERRNGPPLLRRRGHGRVRPPARRRPPDPRVGRRRGDRRRHVPRSGARRRRGHVVRRPRAALPRRRGHRRTGRTVRATTTRLAACWLDSAAIHTGADPSSRRRYGAVIHVCA